MAFDPKRHTIRVQGGREYLPVSARLVWFRNDHPDWGIVTQPVEINLEKQYAIFQCSIFNAEGKLMATATKMENIKGFGDYLEKAETGSVGRALAYCGYGTQFAPELEEGGRFSDAPLAPSAAYGQNGAGNRFARQAAPFGGGNGSNFRPTNSNNAPANGYGSGNGSNGGGNGNNGSASRPLSPRPQPARTEVAEDEVPFDDEMPQSGAPRAEASRPFPPRGEASAARPQPVRVEARETSPPARTESRDAAVLERAENASPVARIASEPASGGGIQRVREPEPEDHGYDTDEDDEDPFGDDEPLPPAATKAPVIATAAAASAKTPGAAKPSADAAPRSGIRPLGEGDSDEDLPAPPLVANKCSVDGCPHTLTASQMTVSQNKFGRLLCLLHQREATPFAAAGGGTKGRAANGGTDSLL